MKRFLFGFVRTFVILLAGFTGYQAWKDGSYIVGAIAFGLFIALIWFRGRQINKAKK